MKGGQGRNRTGDLSLFRRTLLPTELPGLVLVIRCITAHATPTGLEPATSAVTGRRANQLRHGAFWPRVRTLPGARETIAQHMRQAVSGQNANIGMKSCRAPLTLWLLCYSGPHRLAA